MPYQLLELSSVAAWEIECDEEKKKGVNLRNK